MTERFLHYLWQHRAWTAPLTTTDGLPVEVQRVGVYNGDAGPDFLDARVSIGGVLWAGHVEVHVKSSDWNMHRHGDDAAYNNVVLHVVYIDDAPIAMQNGLKPPTVEVRPLVPDELWNRYTELIQPPIPVSIPCMLHVEEVPQLILHNTIDRMAVERMQRKAHDVQRLLTDNINNWESTCYCLVARYMGSKVNAFAFEMLAKVTPLSVVAKIKDNPFRVEALLMGQSGMLDGDFEDEYPLALQKEYGYLRKAYRLSPMEASMWKFFRIRPENFPTVRIALLAQLLKDGRSLFSRLLNAETVDELRGIFDIGTSEYWDQHYRFDTVSSLRKKRLGRTLTDILIINAWLPLLFEYGTQHDDHRLRALALSLQQQMPPENNKYMRMWTSAHVDIPDAAHSQALLQLYSEYCTPRRCIECPIGHHLLRPQHPAFVVPPVLQDGPDED